MRVALVVERFAPGAGGVETVAWNLARELARRDVRTIVFSGRAAPTPPPGVEVVRMRVPSFWQPLRVTAFSRAAARSTRSGFDVVHSLARTRFQDVYRAGGGSHAAYMEAVYRFPGVRRALSPRHRVLLRIEERVFRDPLQLIQCNARRIAEEITRRFGVPQERLVTIYNGVDTDRFHPERRSSQGDELRRELGLKGPVALFLGTGFRRKGLDRAIAGLHAAAPLDATLLVCGTGEPAPYRALAARLGVSERVRFLGHRTDVEQLHAGSDLFVLPTRYDPFSNACLEAMSSGLPVATTPVNGASELIESGQSGIVLEDRFDEAFALLGDPGQLASMGKSARERVKRLTWERHAEDVLAMYRRLGS